MNPRELIILILGLAIVAVVLRGLFVALKARRGQIKLSIDKNIPQDIDLEAMELAELPGGGARVVERSLDSVNAQNSKLDEAQERAIALNLGDLGPSESNIPVLMDAVELGEAVPIALAESGHTTPLMTISDPQDAEQEIVQEHSEYPAPEIGEEQWSRSVESVPSSEPHFDVEDDVEDEAGRSSSEFEPSGHDDAQGSSRDRARDQEPYQEQDFADDKPIEAVGEYDDVLLDYDQNDNDQGDNSSILEADALASIAPDYPEEPANIESNEDVVEEDWESDEPSMEEDLQHRDSELNVQVEEDVSDQDDWDEQDSPDEDGDSNLTEDSGRNSNQSFEEQLDDFSMTAGDRIGYDNSIIKAATAARINPPPQATDSQAGLSEQSVFFDEAKSSSEETTQSSTALSKRSSFFSAFRRKPKEVLEQPVTVEAGTPLAQDKENGIERDEAKVTYKEIDDPSNAGATDDVDNLNAAGQRDRDDKAATANSPSEVLVVNVMARDRLSFAGDDLLQVLITAGLKFGEMNIFHHHIDSNTKGTVLYSVANVLNPGTFDLNNMSNFSTLGVSFFLALPTSINNLDAFETMLSVAQQVKGGLDGDLRDDERNLMTAQTIEHYRQRVRDFELRQLKAGIRG